MPSSSRNWVCIQREGCFVWLRTGFGKLICYQMLSADLQFSLHLCCIPVVLNDATLFPLKLSQHKGQTFNADIMILACKFARCLSLKQTADVSEETMWQSNSHFLHLHAYTCWNRRTLMLQMHKQLKPGPFFSTSNSLGMRLKTIITLVLLLMASLLIVTLKPTLKVRNRPF